MDFVPISPLGQIVSLYKEGEVQDGDYQVYLESVVSRRLGNIHRPEGRVFPRSGTTRLSEVPQGSGRWQGVSVQGCHQY